MGCKKDGNPEISNFLKINEQEYELSQGIIEDRGMDGPYFLHKGYNTDLTLYSEGLTLHTDEQGGLYFSGRGNAIYLAMFSTSGEALDEGDYEFTITQPYQVGTFYYGYYIINYDAETRVSELEDAIAIGTVSVSVKGREFSISLNCKDEGGNKITGQYSGTLGYHNRLDAVGSSGELSLDMFLPQQPSE